MKKCLDSINSALSCLLPQDLRDFRFEARVVFNGESIAPYESSLLQVNSKSIPRSTPSAARNTLIKDKDTNYFYFIDDDTFLSNDFLLKVCEIIRCYPEVDIFGGPDTCSADVSLYEKSLELALRSPLTTLKTRKRHIPDKKSVPEPGHEKNLILCNLCVKGSAFSFYNTYFPEEYQRNEENVFLRALQGKVKISYFSHLYIFHERRPHWRSVFYAASTSGFYRLRMIKDNPVFDQFVFFIPSLFILYLSLNLIMAPLVGLASLLYMPLYAYLFLNLITSLKVASQAKSLSCIPLVMFYQLFIIASYGIGFILGARYETQSSGSVRESVI